MHETKATHTETVTYHGYASGQRVLISVLPASEVAQVDFFGCSGYRSRFKTVQDYQKTFYGCDARVIVHLGDAVYPKISGEHAALQRQLRDFIVTPALASRAQRLVILTLGNHELGSFKMKLIHPRVATDEQKRQMTALLVKEAETLDAKLADESTAHVPEFIESAGYKRIHHFFCQPYFVYVQLDAAGNPAALMIGYNSNSPDDLEQRVFLKKIARILRGADTPEDIAAAATETGFTPQQIAWMLRAPHRVLMAHHSPDTATGKRATDKEETRKYALDPAKLAHATGNIHQHNHDLLLDCFGDLLHTFHAIGAHEHDLTEAVTVSLNPKIRAYQMRSLRREGRGGANDNRKTLAKALPAGALLTSETRAGFSKFVFSPDELRKLTYDATGCHAPRIAATLQHEEILHGNVRSHVTPRDISIPLAAVHEAHNLSCEVAASALLGISRKGFKIGNSFAMRALDLLQQTPHLALIVFLIAAEHDDKGRSIFYSDIKRDATLSAYYLELFTALCANDFSKSFAALDLLLFKYWVDVRPPPKTYAMLTALRHIFFVLERLQKKSLSFENAIKQAWRALQTSADDTVDTVGAEVKTDAAEGEEGYDTEGDDDDEIAADDAEAAATQSGIAMNARATSRAGVSDDEMTAIPKFIVPPADAAPAYWQIPADTYLEPYTHVANSYAVSFLLAAYSDRRKLWRAVISDHPPADVSSCLLLILLTHLVGRSAMDSFITGGFTAKFQFSLQNALLFAERQRILDQAAATPHRIIAQFATLVAMRAFWSWPYLRLTLVNFFLGAVTTWRANAETSVAALCDSYHVPPSFRNAYHWFGRWGGIDKAAVSLLMARIESVDGDEALTRVLNETNTQCYFAISDGLLAPRPLFTKHQNVTASAELINMRLLERKASHVLVCEAI